MKKNQTSLDEDLFSSELADQLIDEVAPMELRGNHVISGISKSSRLGIDFNLYEYAKINKLTMDGLVYQIQIIWSLEKLDVKSLLQIDQ
jgi:hypothetical protein